MLKMVAFLKRAQVKQTRLENIKRKRSLKSTVFNKNNKRQLGNLLKKSKKKVK